MSQSLRNLLFVPGDRPDRLKSAVRCGADAVVIDLEDAVAPKKKREARSEIIRLLEREDLAAAALMVRINGRGSEWFAEDVRALGPVLARLDAVLVPKVEQPVDVLLVEGQLAEVESNHGLLERVRVIPIIETARGVLAAERIASATARIRTLLFGSADLSAELGISTTPEGTEFLQARSMIVLASTAAGLERPLDGPYLVLRDPDGLYTSARAARALGFGGKAVIHPEQLNTVQTVFSLTAEEVAWARRVDTAFSRAAAAGRGVARLEDGTFVDEPVWQRARALLAEVATASRDGLTS